MRGIIDATLSRSRTWCGQLRPTSTDSVRSFRWKDVSTRLKSWIYALLAGGFTVSHAMHGFLPNGKLEGQNCITLKHRWGTKNPNDIIIDGCSNDQILIGWKPQPVFTGDEEWHSAKCVDRDGRKKRVIRNWFKRSNPISKSLGQIKFCIAQKGILQLHQIQWASSKTLANILDGKIIIHCHFHRADWNLYVDQCGSGFQNPPKLVLQHTMKASK